MTTTIQHNITQEFVLGGNATLTITFPERDGKDHYTFHISRKEADGQWPEAYFVRMLVDGDTWIYVGKLDTFTLQVKVTNASKIRSESFPFRALNRVLLQITQGQPGLNRIREAGWNVMHEGHCGVCGRELTNPESIETGIGPVCRNRI